MEEIVWEKSRKFYLFGSGRRHLTGILHLYVADTRQVVIKVTEDDISGGNQGY